MLESFLSDEEKTFGNRDVDFRPFFLLSKQSAHPDKNSPYLKSVYIFSRQQRDPSYKNNLQNLKSLIQTSAKILGPENITPSKRLSQKSIEIRPTPPQTITKRTI